MFSKQPLPFSLVLVMFALLVPGSYQFSWKRKLTSASSFLNGFHPRNDWVNDYDSCMMLRGKTDDGSRASVMFAATYSHNKLILITNTQVVFKMNRQKSLDTNLTRIKLNENIFNDRSIRYYWPELYDDDTYQLMMDHPGYLHYCYAMEGVAKKDGQWVCLGANFTQAKQDGVCYNMVDGEVRADNVNSTRNMDPTVSWLTTDDNQRMYQLVMVNQSVWSVRAMVYDASSKDRHQNGQGE